MLVFAIDYSGSTSEEKEYWSKVLDSVQRLSKLYSDRNQGTSFIFWNTEAEKVSNERAMQTIFNGVGRHGTNPSSFIPLLPSNEEFDCCIITDGEINNREVEICKAKLGNSKLKFGKIYFEIHGNYQKNLSVIAPFMNKTNGNVEVHLTGRDAVNGVEVFNLPARVELSNVLDKIVDLNEFILNYEQIYNLVLRVNFGNSDPMLRSMILKLQNRLILNSGKTLLVEEKGFAEASKRMMKLASDFYADSCGGSNLTRLFQKLLLLCSVKHNYDLNILRSNRVLTAKELEMIEAPKEEIRQTIQPISCPISFDSDVAVLLLLGSGVLSHVDPSILNQIISSPLSALNYLSVYKAISDGLGSIIGAKSFNSLQNNTDPFTRQKIKTFIPLQRSEGLDNIYYFLFGGKKLGSIEQWLVVIWEIMRGRGSRYQDEGFDGMKLMENLIREQALYKVAPMALSVTHEFPRDQVYFHQALTYILSSSVFGCPGILPFPYEGLSEGKPNRDRFRGYYYQGSYNAIKRTLSLLYAEDTDFQKLCTDLDLYANCLSVVQYFITNGSNDDIRFFLDLNRARDQKAFIYPRERVVVFLDGQETDGSNKDQIKRMLPTNWFKLKPRTIDHLHRISHQVALSSISLNFEELKASEDSKVPFIYERFYSDSENSENYEPVQICPLTMRPWTLEGTWEEKAVEKFGPIKAQVSYYYLLALFVLDFEVWGPDLIVNDEVIDLAVPYIAKKQRRGMNPIHTLPASCKHDIEVVLNIFKDAVEKLQLSPEKSRRDVFEHNFRNAQLVEKRMTLEKEWLN